MPDAYKPDVGMKRFGSPGLRAKSVRPVPITSECIREDSLYLVAGMITLSSLPEHNLHLSQNLELLGNKIHHGPGCL